MDFLVYYNDLPQLYHLQVLVKGLKICSRTINGGEKLVFNHLLGCVPDNCALENPVNLDSAAVCKTTAAVAVAVAKGVVTGLSWCN